MSEEEKEAIKFLEDYVQYFNDKRDRIILNLIKKQQKEIERLKYSIKKATKIIDEYANETEKDTKKLIEYQEKITQELLEE